MSSLRPSIIFLSLILCLLIPQRTIGDPKSGQKAVVIKKKSTSKKQNSSKLSCPYPIDKKAARRLINDWMQAEMWGQTRSTLTKPICLKRETKYKLALPGPPRDVQTSITPLLANRWQLLQLKRSGENKFSTDYRAKIRITGTLRGKPSSFSQEVLFGFPKGTESKLFGCVMLHSSWEREFITKRCLK